MKLCSNCTSPVQVERVRCTSCGLAFEGRFCQPRLARLEPDHQKLVEQFVLGAGNLKEVAGKLDTSYPTLRKRLDGLIAALKALMAEDAERADALLARVEAQELPAEEAARLIKEMNGAA